MSINSVPRRLETTPQKSELMKHVRQSGTSIELQVREIADTIGLAYKTNVKSLPGSPDLASPEERWAVFAHGCYWHSHDCSLATIPKRNHEFWIDKFLRNKQRDAEKISALKRLGFDVSVVWQCELKTPKIVSRKLLEAIEGAHKRNYTLANRCVSRTLLTARAGKYTARLKTRDVQRHFTSAQDAWDWFYLRQATPPRMPNKGSTVRIADLFSGCGLLTLGAMEACRALGLKFVSEVAIDVNEDAAEVYKNNFNPKNQFVRDIETLLDGALGRSPTNAERRFMTAIKQPHILLAGPPCQGYSDLNNHTRRNDPRNDLYARVARFAELFRPEHILIENVKAVTHGKEKAFTKSREHLENLGYYVDSGIVKLSSIGIPQQRNRHVLVASTKRKLAVKQVIVKHKVDRIRTVSWALKDLENTSKEGLFDSPSISSEENKRRIRHLFENNLYNLPNEERPECHRNGEHSYKSMYGRLKWDKPAQTITTGFGSPGQGRYIHPSRKRTITPHEAARLQFFPDFFDFSSVKKRGTLARLIGNAAPMKLSYVFCHEFLSNR